jgi:hypothetical protein
LPSKKDCAIASENSSDSDAADRSFDWIVSGLNRYKKVRHIQLVVNHLCNNPDIAGEKKRLRLLPRVRPVAVEASLLASFAVAWTHRSPPWYSFVARPVLPPAASCVLEAN